MIHYQNNYKVHWQIIDQTSCSRDIDLKKFNNLGILLTSFKN